MRHVQLPASFFSSNRERLVAHLPAQSLAILSSNDVMPTNADGTMAYTQNSDLFYLSGVDQQETILLLFPGARDPKMREVLFVREPTERLAIWDGAQLTKAQARAVSGVETVLWLDEFDLVTRNLMFEAQTVYLPVNEHLRSVNAVPTRDWRLLESLRRDYPLHSYARLAPLIYRMRMVKSPAEVEAVREATRITEAGFRRAMKFVKPGVTEYQVEAELAHEYIGRRSRAFSFLPIIATGENACVLHYLENSATCQDGEMLLMDVAAEYGYYRSDMTRTIPVNGRFTPRQRDIYNAVLRVLRACNQMLRPGVIVAEYQKETEKIMEGELVGLGLIDRDAIKNQDPDQPLYKRYFMHGVSHHIGLDVHDVHDGGVPLSPDMLLTIEPGIYIREEKLAVRLENIVLIGAEQNEDLMANVPIEADEIEAAMNC